MNLGHFVEQEAPSYVFPEEMILELDIHQDSKKKYDEFYKRHSALFHKINNQFSYWNEKEEWSDRWNLGESGFYYEVARKSKVKKLEDEAFRYFRTQTRKPLRDQLEEWQQGLDRDYEVDEANTLSKEGQEKIFIYDEKGYNALLTRKANEKKYSKNKKEIKLAKQYKFRLKPRIFKGILITQFDNPYADLRVITGVNKEVDIQLSRNFTKLRLYTTLNYEATSGRTLASIDKKLGQYFRLRVSSKFNYKEAQDLQEEAANSTLYSLNFFMRF